MCLGGEGFFSSGTEAPLRPWVSHLPFGLSTAWGARRPPVTCHLSASAVPGSAPSGAGGGRRETGVCLLPSAGGLGGMFLKPPSAARQVFLSPGTFDVMLRSLCRLQRKAKDRECAMMGCHHILGIPGKSHGHARPASPRVLSLPPPPSQTGATETRISPSSARDSSGHGLLRQPRPG